MKRISFLTLALLAALYAAAPPAASADEMPWPQRTVKLIVPFGPGSGADLGARLFAERLATRWGKPVVVENRPGGDAIVGISAFVTAADDHTLLFTAASAFTVHPYTHEQLPYGSADLVPIARVSETMIALSAPYRADFDNLREFVGHARAAPGTLNAAVAAGLTDLIFRGFMKERALDIAMVPYRDITGAVPDVAEGRIQLMFSAYAVAQPQVQAGKIKVLAVTNTSRSPFTPDIPTVAESGFPSLAMSGLVGLFGPRVMSAAVRDRIAADLRDVARTTPAIGERLAATGQILSVAGPDDLAAAIDRQRARVAAAAATLGIQPIRH